MPVAGVGNGRAGAFEFVPSSNMNGNGVCLDGDPCDCCPYGFHIDRDFVPFSKKMLSREGDVQRIQEMKDKWRRERQSMDKLLGLAQPKLVERNQSYDQNIGSRSPYSVVDNWRSFNLDPTFSSYQFRTHQDVSVGGNGNSFDYICGSGLNEAMAEFEDALERSRHQDRFSYDIPDSQKYHTFPRLKDESPSTVTVCRSPMSPYGSLRRRTRTFDTGVQVNACEFDETKMSVPILQIIEKVDFGTQTIIEIESPSASVQPVKKVSVKSIGITAKPKTVDVGVMQKPEQKEAKCNTVDNGKVRTKHVGVTACLDAPPPPVEEKPQIVKSVRHIASNTDKLKSRTVSLSTTELTSYSTNATQTIVEEGSPDTEEWESGYFSPKRKIEKASNTSPVLSRKNAESGGTAVSPIEPSKGQSRIPRLASPSISPGSSPKVTTKSFVGAKSDDLRSSSPRPIPAKPTFERSDTYTKEIIDIEEDQANANSASKENTTPIRGGTYNINSPIPERREKAKPSKEMQGALKVLNDALLRGKTTDQVTKAVGIIVNEWFRVAGTITVNPLDVEDYLDVFESYSPQLIRYIVNVPDGNGNTAMHYAVSNGNFDIVSILLDSKFCDPNKANKAGYTSLMLVSLAKVLSDTHRQVVRRLFSTGDVNIKAAQHGQTALMLTASQGELDIVKLLVEAGADINIKDEDGSTALMCATEHGHGNVVKYFLTQPDCDVNLEDNDGSTALQVAMDANHKDIAVMLYAHMHFMVDSPPSPYAGRKNLVKRPLSQSSPSTPRKSDTK